MDLSRYVLEVLRDDRLTALYRGRRTDRSGSVLVLMPASQEAAATSLQRFEHEDALSEQLHPAWAAVPLHLGYHRGQPVLILADPGGLPLGQLLGAPMPPGRFLTLAVGLAAAVRQMHERGLVHKDIRPANVLAEAAGEVWLTGFGLASRVQRERPSPASAKLVEGTPAYMAPEQTGRMNRSIDQRSDLYSLGVTFYEMLTGALPFNAVDAVDWIHSHLARPPIPPTERLPGLSPTLEAIVLKLLQKRAEDRYQTVRALEADLRRCLDEWTARGAIAPFALAENDRPDRLLIPESLYGRADALDRLLGAFDRVALTGRMEVVLLSGPAGIGKSALVGELQKATVGRPGLYAGGKFDQYQRDIPYATVAAAFQDLVRQILTLDEAELDCWRADLLDALGPNGRLMTNLVPDLAIIIGDQPPAPDLPAADAQNRFHRVFQRLLAVFARPERPLVLFLDDVQWLDPGTIELIERLAAEPDVGHLLLICAYRDNEVEASHRLARALETISAQTRHERLRLEPLTPAHVTQFLADALNSPTDSIGSLAGPVADKTGGNPFYLAQFLTALADEELLVFDHGTNAWRWDEARIAARTITENVADLMMQRLARLPDAVLTALKTLACLGNGTPLRMIAIALGRQEREMAEALRPAVDAGFVLRLAGDFAFAHDRIQEAAYRLIPEDERPAQHLATARALLAGLTQEEIEERIFQLVDQFGRGLWLIQSGTECERIAALHLSAGTRAKTSTAYDSALKYLAAGDGLLERHPHSDTLAFHLHLALAECEFLTSRHSAAEQRLSSLAERAREPADRAAVTRLRLALYTTLGDTAQAVDVGLADLSQIGIDWSAHPADAVVQDELAAVRRLLDGRSIAQLAELPRMNDPARLAAMDVLAWLIMPALITDKNLEAVIILRMVSLSLQHGNCDASCYAYSQVNLVVGLRFGDYRAGRDFGRLARELVDQHGMDRYKARVYSCFSSYVAPWSEHLPTILGLIQAAIVTADAVGDPIFVVAAYRALVASQLVAGTDLAEVEREAENYLRLARTTGFALAADCAESMLLLVRELRGTADMAVVGAERKLLERHLVEAGAPLTLAFAWYLIHRMQATFISEDLMEARVAEAKAAPVVDAAATFVDIVDYHFYGALIEACDDAGAGLDRVTRLTSHHRRIATWAEHCPENFAARALLIAAEIARLERREADALQHYDDAIRSARENGFVQVEAIACERAAAFLTALGRDRIATVHLRGARSAYRRWGAGAKVDRLDRRHPGLFEEPAQAAGTAATAIELFTARPRRRDRDVAGRVGRDRPRPAHRTPDDHRNRALRRLSRSPASPNGRPAAAHGGGNDPSGRRRRGPAATHDRSGCPARGGGQRRGAHRHRRHPRRHP